MKFKKHKTATLLGALLMTTSAAAQHGISFDWGKRLPEDSARMTKAGIGLTHFADSLNGMQLSVISNVAMRGKGLQLGGISNISLSPFKGWQIAGITNISTGTEHGVQTSALLNVSSKYMRGAQIGTYNYADTLNGTQIGLINVARRHPRGWQIGILNYSRDTLAHKVGLLNINPATTIDMMAFAGTSSKLNFALRLRNKSTYNILGVGTHYMGLDKRFSGTLYYRIGKYFRLAPKWTVSGDIGYFHIETFAHHTADKPERLFSIQARLNADYQINERLGAFASVGWGDTRYYDHARSYRNRPLMEAGLTIRYPNNTPKDDAQTWIKKEENPWDDDNPLINKGLGKKHPWWALAEVTGVNVGVHLFDRFVTSEDFAQTTLNTWKDNFRNGFVWDNDMFTTNLFMHPYHGNLYFNSARSQGLNFWESVAYPMVGSLEWELLGETEPPAINDLIATTFGGICIGEIANRISHIVLDDSRQGWPRFWREALAAVINPMQAFKRFATGDAWNVRNDHNRYHDYFRNPLDFSVSVGSRYLADDGSLFRGENNPYINFFLEYGDPINEDEYNQPYDFFDAEVTFGLSSNQPVINRLNLMGRLWSTPMIDAKRMYATFGIYQHFDYFDSKPVKNGSDLTPYRISEAAAFGPGIIMQMEEVGMLSRLEQRIFANGILLGGTKSDYYNFIERDYNMGSGFGLKSKTHMEMRHFGRFILHVQYYQIYTWKGYEQKDLSKVNLYHLNAQGDKGNARLLIINPIIELDIRKNISLVGSLSRFFRHTHYKYYDDVNMDTFEMRIGLVAHI